MNSLSWFLYIAGIVEGVEELLLVLAIMSIVLWLVKLTWLSLSYEVD